MADRASHLDAPKCLLGMFSSPRSPCRRAVQVGQQPVVFMDEISTGLDSATAYSVIKTFRQAANNRVSILICR